MLTHNRGGWTCGCFNICVSPVASLRSGWSSPTGKHSHCTYLFGFSKIRTFNNLQSTNKSVLEKRVLFSPSLLPKREADYFPIETRWNVTWVETSRHINAMKNGRAAPLPENTEDIAGANKVPIKTTLQSWWTVCFSLAPMKCPDLNELVHKPQVNPTHV